MYQTFTEMLEAMKHPGDVRPLTKMIAAQAAGPARDIAAVTVSDTVDDPAGPFHGLLVRGITTGSTLKVRTVAGNDVTLDETDLLTLAGGAAGRIDLQVLRIWDTGTTLADTKGLV